jgi:hypothetical protein
MIAIFMSLAIRIAIGDILRGEGTTIDRSVGRRLRVARKHDRVLSPFHA